MTHAKPYTALLYLQLPICMHHTGSCCQAATAAVCPKGRHSGCVCLPRSHRDGQRGGSQSRQVLELLQLAHSSSYTHPHSCASKALLVLQSRRSLFAVLYVCLWISLHTHINPELHILQSKSEGTDPDLQLAFQIL